jgi:radical SAM superfamily enzyme YgiQ (UPF0313 family)
MSGFFWRKMKALRVILGDLSYYNRHSLNTIYTPLNTGFVGQYINQVFGKDIRTNVYKDPIKLIEAVKENKPDVVGLSLYYWNTNLDQHVIQQIRSICGDQVVIVLGGPSIDEDETEQKHLLERFSDVDAIIVNEGELGFSNIVKATLSNRNSMWSSPIDGAVFLRDSELVKGESVGLSLDLATLDSPYLSGLMDDFLYGEYQPLLQTSRFCPYTCTFCVSGKLRGKLRAFPEEQVFEEITFLSKIYADRPNLTLYIADENFGILERDHKIAAHIRNCSETINYPTNVFFYNDKRFTETSKKVVETLGNINQIGLTLALQSENQETLKAINRRNVTEEDIENALAWAKTLDIPTTTELIFGMPFETRDSFVDLLNRSVNRGFDSVLCHNLFLVNGIELNRPDAREKYKIQAKFRLLGTNYGSLGGEFFAEHEEVVVSTESFDFEDFMEIRGLNFLFFVVFSMDFYKWFFQHIRSIKVPLVEFFTDFLKPDRSAFWPKDYLIFLRDFQNMVSGELFDTEDELYQHAKNTYLQNNNDVGEPQRINVYLGARLIFCENSWLKDVLKRHLEKYVDLNNREVEETVDFILDLCERERINPRYAKGVEQLPAIYDVVSWKKNKFQGPLLKIQSKPQNIIFSIDNDSRLLIDSFNKKFSYLDNKEFYYSAFDHIQPRSRLLRKLTYVESK